MVLWSVSQSEPARNAMIVRNAYQIPEASAMMKITGRNGSFAAPANTGTTARTAGKNRLTNSDGMPYFLYDRARRTSASGPIHLAKPRSSTERPYLRPVQYIPAAPATFDSQVTRNVTQGLPWPRAARKLPNATTASV